MIVVDTNVLAYFAIEGPNTASAKAVFNRDPVWSAPLLWKSELRNILLNYLRREKRPLEWAMGAFEQAEMAIGGREFDVKTPDVLSLAARSGCTAYDCEFVSLALDLGVPLVTCDKQILKAFPAVAVPLSGF